MEECVELVCAEVEVMLGEEREADFRGVVVRRGVFDMVQIGSCKFPCEVVIPLILDGCY